MNNIPHILIGVLLTPFILMGFVVQLVRHGLSAGAHLCDWMMDYLS